MKAYEWSCLTKAASILISKPEAEIIEKIGHNGSEILWPDAHEPACRRGFHVQEIVHVLHQYGYWVIQIDPIMLFQSLPTQPIVSIQFDCLPEYLSRYSGILIGRRHNARHNHAVVWLDNKIIDPDGSTLILPEFKIESSLFVSNNLLKS